MHENPIPQFESGDTVNTYEELFEAMKGQPKGYNLLINIWWGEQNILWEKVERNTGLKIAIRLKRTYQHEGKQACLLEFEVVS
jgi:hypothetical protein